VSSCTEGCSHRRFESRRTTPLALQNAASVSTLLLTSDALIADIPEEKKPAAGGPHGGGYDDDMY